MIMDLPSASTYPLISVEPGYVLVSYLEDSTIPVFINVTFSGRVPHLKRAGLVSFSLLRRVTQQTAFEAFDAIFSSSQLDREGCTNITFDSSIHNQIIMCIGRFHVLQLSTACEVLDMVTYFDPHCSIEVNFNRCGFHQAVYSPCPPIDLFERYIQVPVTTDKDDLVQLVSSSHPAHHTQSPPPLSIQFPDQSGGDQRVLDPTTIELLSSKTMHSSESGNVGNATGPLKLAKSRLGGQDESFIDALVDSLMSKSSPAQFPHNNTSSGVRMTDHHRTQSDPPHMKLGGHEGSAMLTADMMEVSREACASTAEISALLSQARRHPRALIGWQVC